MSGPGKGIHINYPNTNMPDAQHGGTNPEKIDFLRKLYSTGPDMSLKAVLERAKEYLDVPRYQDAPDITSVAWGKPGDPSSPYTPDIRAPGMAVSVEELGSTDTTSIKTGFTLPSDAPSIKGDELVKVLAPNLIPGAPGTATRSPKETSVKIDAGTSLGADYPTNPLGTELYK